MYVIPLADNFQKKFPVVTLGLIVLSCLVFFSFQLNEDEGIDDAVAFSQASGLLKVEAVAYQEFLKTEKRELPAAFKEDQNSRDFIRYMLADDRFQHELLDHALITPSDPDYNKWWELRQIFEADLARVFSRNYGYSPARNNYMALFTSMFLHGSFLHLFVNMVFLWFVGSLLENGIGRRYLGGYVLAGFCGSVLFGLIFPIAQGPLVGSSGAIAGLMGTYMVLYSRVTLRAVHSLKFSIDYPHIAGWFLLPFWMVNEIVQIYTSTGSDGVYVVHIGGLLIGLGFGLSSLARNPDAGLAPVEAKKTVSKVDSLLEKVEWQLAVKRRSEARENVLKLLKIEPENILALAHLFNIDKNMPESDDFPVTASLFLGHLAKIKGNYDIEKYFEEYLTLCPTAKVQPDLLLGVATAYTHTGKTEAASKILVLLLKLDPDNPGLPAALFNLAQIYRAANNKEKATKCYRILCAHYPETNSGRKAKEMISPQLTFTIEGEE